MIQPKLIRSAASREGEVDLKKACECCGQTGFRGKKGDMIFCDACDDAYHFKCLSPMLSEAPEDFWVCPNWPACQEKEEEGAAVKRPRLGQGAATYEHLLPPRMDKSGLRRAAGLDTGQFPTSEFLDQLLEFRWAPRTARSYEAASQRFVEFCDEGRLTTQDLESLCLYAVRRLQRGVASGTIRREIIGIRQKRKFAYGCEERLQQTLRVVERLADVPSESRLPMTPDLMRALRRTIGTWASRSRYAEDIRRRDWGFYLLGFLGFFRGSELTQLLWAHLRFEWRKGSEVRTTGAPEAPGDRSQWMPEAVQVHVVISKTDPDAKGQVVRVAAKTRGDDLNASECPFRMLRDLWARRRPGAAHVFANPADGGGLTTNTMLGRLKRYMAQLLSDPKQARRYGLHSLRRGGATAAYRLGATKQEIQRIGRWKSDVVFLYTAVADEDALAVTQRVLEGLNLEE